MAPAVSKHRAPAGLRLGEIRALVRTLGVDPGPSDLEEITHRLNRLLEGLRQLESLEGFTTEPWQSPDAFWRD